METLLEYKCPSCGGALSFDSGLQKMKCPYCDSELEVAALKELDEALKNEPVEDMSWQAQEGCDWQDGETESLVSYACQSCGGEILTDANTSATSCPFCGNPVVMTRNVSGSLRPDCVVPFQLDKAAAQEAFKKHLSGKPLLPKTFKSESFISQVKGVYVPFWLFDSHADADARYRATRLQTWSDSRYRYTRTSYYSVSRGGNMDFSAVPVDGSSKMDDTLMESLEPYDVSKAVDFQTAYLAGYFADKYDVTAQQTKLRANTRIKTSVEQVLRQSVVGYASVIPENCNVRLSGGKIRYALYPVWLLNCQYRGENYLFAMNGQTGKMVGDLPVDWGAFWRWFGLIALGASTVCCLIAGFSGLL